MMQGKKPQKQVVAYVEKSSISTSQNVSIIPVNFSPGKNFNFSNRNLRKEDLAGAIFGCKDDTMRECLGGQIFGLPSTHFQYVKNIEPGLPLFLLNYDDRKLYGIFEAASNGQININPYGWSGNGYEKTKFPAQVRVCPRKHCQPLSEKQFKPIIIANYHCSNRFWFELDHDQSAALISLFESSPANLAVAFPLYKVPQLKMNKKLNISLSENSMESVLSRMNNPIQNTCVDGHKSLENDFDKEEGRNEEQIPHAKLHKLASENETSNPSSISHSEDNFAPSKTNGMHVEDKCSLVINAASVTTQKYEVISASSSDLQPFVDKLRQGIAELKAVSQEQSQKTTVLEKKLAESVMEVQQLRNRVELLESQQDSSIAFIDINEVCSGTSQLIFLLGGFDSISWLSALDCYSPSRDSTRSLRPMSSVRSYAAAAVLDKQIYIFGGGGDNDTWYDSVESYDPISNEWNSCPSLIERKGDLAGAALHGKLYAMGGGTGHECYSGVEMFDPALGRWIPTQSMMHKRFASAAVELNGALYVVGGYDGENYLKSAERFDPREEVSWKSFPSMNAGRGSHSLVVYNEKIYALGGHDGTKIVNSVELFDPRMGSWMISDSMKQTRGYSSAAVMDSSIYVIGGLQDGMKFLDTVERYKEGEGWRITHSKAVGERCAFSAVVL